VTGAARGFTQYLQAVAYPGILFGGGAVSANSVEDRENGDLGAVALQSGGSGGGCNLVQEISFHIVFFFFIQCPTCP